MSYTISKNIGFLFCLFLTFNGIGQSSIPEEIAYQRMFDEMIAGDLPDTAKFQFFADSLRKIKYYNSKLPFEYAKKGIAMAEASNNDYWSGRLKNTLGRYYVNTGVWDSSIVYLKSALIDLEKANKPRGLTYGHGLLRYAYSMNNDLEKSLEHCFKKLKIHEDRNEELGIGATYNDIAGTYLVAKDYEEALVYAIKGKEILMRHKNILEQVRVTGKIGRCHLALGDFESALGFYNEAIEIAKLIKREATEVKSELYRDRSNLYLEMKQFENAQKDIENARALFKGKSNPSYLCELDYNEANILLKQGKFKAAKNIFLAVLANEQLDFVLSMDKTIYLKLSKTYAGLEQYDSTYFYQLEYEKISMSEKRQASKLEMEKLKAKYQIEQKEATIAAQSAQLSQQRTIQWLGLAFVSVLGLLLFQFYRNAKTRKRTSEALEKTNVLLESKNQENEVLLKEIHHRVKNNLQTISSLLSLQSESITDQSALDAVAESRSRVASMGLIHQKLYQGDNLAAIEMKDYFKTIGSTIIESFGEKAAGVELEVTMSEIELNVDTAIPIGLITNELITNSLKHAFKKNGRGKISIQLEKGVDNLMQLVISDNGIFDASSAKEKEGAGFGSLLVNLLTTQLDGEIEQSTVDGTVTKIQFKIAA